MSEPWLGSNYSTRIWNNNEQFIERVQQTIEDGIIGGHSISRMADNLEEYVKVPDQGQRYIVERLARSETAHFMAEGQLQSYKEIGIEKYQFVAALSERTCDTCGGLDGEVIDVSRAVSGENYPPIHANCRCTTVMAGFNPSTRIARDPLTGKNYKVDGSMTFEEWKDSLTDEQRAAMKYVDKSCGNGIIKSNNVGMAVNDVHYIGKLDKEIYKCVTKDIKTDDVIITDTQVKHIKERHPNDYERYFKYANEIIKHPDYILEANKPNTAFLLKHIEDNNKHYQLILRLKTSEDPADYKNSVITFLKVEEKRYNRYLRTKKILYKSE